MTEDELQAASTRAAAEAMGQWLIGAGIVQKRIIHLNMAELENMATAAISGWVVKRAELLKIEEQKTSPLIPLA